MQNIEQIELNLKQAKAMVDMGRSLERLRSNRDFKAVIMEGYFKEEAIRLVHLKSSASMQDADSQASIIRDMDAIGALNQYFNTLNHRAMLSEKAIEDDSATREELLSEEIE